MITHILAFLSSLIGTAILVIFVKKLAVKLDIVDRPGDDKSRKIHTKPTPLLGGLAVFLGLVLTSGLFAIFSSLLPAGDIKVKHLIGILTGGTIIMIGGFIDDKYSLKPRYQLIGPILAVIAVIISGIGITAVTNPLGGLIQLDRWHAILFWHDGWPYRITILADLFTLTWLMGMMYTTKFLDGLDGLVSGVTIIGALGIFALSLTRIVSQPETALLAILVAGAFAGFLIFNWNPAKIFLGEGGSIFAGFMLGVLGIVSGSKVATTLLIIGIPALDVAWVIFRRIVEGRSPADADNKHLHHRLLKAGFSQKKVVLLLYFLTAYFAITALFLQNQGKFLAFAVLSTIMALLLIGLYLINKRRVLDSGEIGAIEQDKDSIDSF